MMHRVGLVGGTFDRFHSGHRSLIEKALSKCSSIEVWISSDEMAGSKDSLIKNWDKRKEELMNDLSEFSSKISTHVLTDNFGPAPFHNEASAIFCTDETSEQCEEINLIREKNGLSPLEINIVRRSLAWDGKPISSSRIRSGIIDREGQPWIPEILREKTAHLSSEVESQLKKPFGDLIEGPEENPSVAIREAISLISEIEAPIIAVGDVTVLSLQIAGRPADISLIDGQTKREKWSKAGEIDPEIYHNVIDCISPAGTLTKSLLEACEESIISWSKMGESTLIRVQGEEDLAPLILHPLLPIGAVVLYGQPGKGVVLRWCNEESKNRCRKLLGGFEFY
ncbi:MAG: hypothetical protein CMB67_03910 [Euryarchaeota archaeon]|nr:hypothetical protein [Euryarchaeota archaeon]